MSDLFRKVCVDDELCVGDIKEEDCYWLAC